MSKLDRYFPMFDILTLDAFVYGEIDIIIKEIQIQTVHILVRIWLHNADRMS